VFVGAANRLNAVAPLNPESCAHVVGALVAVGLDTLVAAAPLEPVPLMGVVLAVELQPDITKTTRSATKVGNTSDLV